MLSMERKKSIEIKLYTVFVKILNKKKDICIYKFYLRFKNTIVYSKKYSEIKLDTMFVRILIKKYFAFDPRFKNTILCRKNTMKLNQVPRCKNALKNNFTFVPGPRNNCMQKKIQ